VLQAVMAPSLIDVLATDVATGMIHAGLQY